MNLYWVTTPDGNENWFVIAKNKRKAEQFHESAEGYGENYANARLVCAISKNLCLKYKIGDGGEDWPTHELLIDLGAKIISEENPRIVNIEGKVYKEGNFTESFFQNDHEKQPGIYVITVQNTQHYKIGSTTNLSKRLQEIKISNPQNLKLVYFVATEHYKSLEAHLHKTFKTYRGRGEWFNFNEDDLYELEMNLLLLEKEGKGLFKFYNIKALSIHGRQY